MSVALNAHRRNPNSPTCIKFIICYNQNMRICRSRNFLLLLSESYRRVVVNVSDLEGRNNKWEKNGTKLIEIMNNLGIGL